MSWYIYNDLGENILVVHASDLLEAQREAAYILGHRDFSIERS